MPKKDMLINYIPGEECRIAILINNRLEELYTERTSDELHVGNIYRGRITNVEPSIQAAFIDFGLDRNGFLHISDLHPKYFHAEESATERVGKKIPRRSRPPIQNCLKRGQEILVQVLKEGIGSKGPTLTSYISIPGRFLVMMPGMSRLGVSRKIEDEQVRRDMRKTLDELNPPSNFGFIIRTAGMGRTKTELKRDLAYLQRLWKAIDSRRKSGSDPVELYTESDLVIRTIRDILSTDIRRIIVDNQSAAQRATDFLRIAMPRGSTKVIHYDKSVPMFSAFDVERQIQTINSRKVSLKCGGSLVIEQTEALVSIDVNSGKFRDNKDAETTAFRTNAEAVDEIARQLRLRDLGGVIVLDLIDMYMSKHRREIEKLFRDHIKDDRARTKVLRINELGLMTLTRQRMRPSLKRSLYDDCPSCRGSGQVLSPESVAIDIMRQLALVLNGEAIHHVQLRLNPKTISALVNRKKKSIVDLERRLGKAVEIVTDQTIAVDNYVLEGFDSRNVKIDLAKLPQPKIPNFEAPDKSAIEKSKPAAKPQPQQRQQRPSGKQTRTKRAPRKTTQQKPKTSEKPSRPPARKTAGNQITRPVSSNSSNGNSGNNRPRSSSRSKTQPKTTTSSTRKPQRRKSAAPARKSN